MGTRVFELRAGAKHKLPIDFELLQNLGKIICYWWKINYVRVPRVMECFQGVRPKSHSQFEIYILYSAVVTIHLLFLHLSIYPSVCLFVCLFNRRLRVYSDRPKPRVEVIMTNHNLRYHETKQFQLAVLLWSCVGIITTISLRAFSSG